MSIAFLISRSIILPLGPVAEAVEISTPVLSANFLALGEIATESPHLAGSDASAEVSSLDSGSSILVAAMGSFS